MLATFISQGGNTSSEDRALEHTESNTKKEVYQAILQNNNNDNMLFCCCIY